MLASYGIIPKPATVKKLMAQLLIKCIHSPLAKALHTKIFEHDYFEGELDNLLQLVT